jgi:hypothetical protein
MKRDLPVRIWPTVSHRCRPEMCQSRLLGPCSQFKSRDARYAAAWTISAVDLIVLRDSHTGAHAPKLLAGCSRRRFGPKQILLEEAYHLHR